MTDNIIEGFQKSILQNIIQNKPFQTSSSVTGTLKTHKVIPKPKR